MNFKTLLSILIVVFFASNVFAKNVDMTTAEKVARNYYFQQSHYFDTPISYEDIQLSDGYVKSYNNVPVMYVFDIAEGGFILVSAEDAMYPVIGYSNEKGTKFDMEGHGPEFKAFMESMMEMISKISLAKTSQEVQIAEEWKLYTTDNTDSLIASKDDVEVGPFLTSTWNQDDLYNYYAPIDPEGPDGRCYAGCVATAMSVVMHYWGYPYSGEGSSVYYCAPYGVQTADYGEAFYNWEAMPNSLSQQSNDDQILNVALIQRHCGVSVNMQYAPDGSGAMSADVPNALHSYFKYPYASFVSRTNTNTWETLLINQLDQSLPLYYSGSDPASGGHAFMCDGYRIVGSNKTFHFNFNWGGSGNGWFTSSNPSGFAQNQGIIKDFYPDPSEYPTYIIENKVLTSKYGRIDDGSGPVENYLNGTHNSWIIKPQSDLDTISDITLNWEKFQISEGDYVNIYDGENSSAPLLATCSGTELPGKVNSTGNSLYVEFVGNGSDQGFVFYYVAHRYKWCSQSTTENDICGTISSNPENYYYNPSSVCRWTIKYPESVDGGYVKFNYLQTYDENDFVTIYDLGTQELYTFYGYETPEEKISFSPQGCLVTFKTNNFMQEGNGFSLYYADNSNVGIITNDFPELSVYPNPVSDQLYVSFNSAENQNVDYRIFNTTGMTVINGSINNATGDRTTKIDVSNLPTGIYFLKLTGSNNISTRKFIVE